MNRTLASSPPRVFSAVFPVTSKMERSLRRDKVKYAWECNLTVREAPVETEYKRIPRGHSFFRDNSVIIEMKCTSGDTVQNLMREIISYGAKEAGKCCG